MKAEVFFGPYKELGLDRDAFLSTPEPKIQLWPKWSKYSQKVNDCNFLHRRYFCKRSAWLDAHNKLGLMTRAKMLPTIGVKSCAEISKMVNMLPTPTIFGVVKSGPNF